jgi:hypothetical protein
LNPTTEKLSGPELSTLLRGEVTAISGWSETWNTRRFCTHVAIIIFGAGFYGAAMGWWRAPEQALFVGIKFPLIILMTTFGNALINGMLAPLLGLNIPFRQSFSAVVMSFAVTSAILGAFAPLLAFVVWNTPVMNPSPSGATAYGFILMTHVLVIALAGTTGNLRLYQLLSSIGGQNVARRVLMTWLGGNLFLGSQLSWILRPFIGSPQLPVEFYRANALHGNFYEAVFGTLKNIF